MSTQDCNVDVAIIGAGVSGASIARTLSRYQTTTILLEKEADVSFQTSKANSGIIHGGFHHHKKHLKTELEIKGNAMFDRLQRELKFPFQRCGILVVAMRREELKYLWHLYQQGIDNGVQDLEICSREKLFSLEPDINADAEGALYVPGGGIVEPYLYGFSLVESALKNGVRLLTGFKVDRAEFSENRYTVHAADGRRVSARFVVNAAGLYADVISDIFNAEQYTIKPRKGEYFVLDKTTKTRPRHVLFPVPNNISKGILIIPTIEGTVLIGPTADIADSKEDVSTTQEKLDMVINASRQMMREVSRHDAINSFAGLRPTLAGGDFYIDISKKAPCFIQVAGIQSPGLTASPAIGEYVQNLLEKAGLTLVEKTDYDPFLEETDRYGNISMEKADELIKKNPAFGNIVCRCENISEAEIVTAIQKGHHTIDGIKFYSRAGMGRCQGSFCKRRIMKILMRETGMSFREITKHGPGSELLSSDRLGFGAANEKTNY